MNKSSLQYLFHPTRLLVRLDQKDIIRLKDEIYLKWLFKWKLGYKLNLNNPKTFNEKIQWLKLHDKQDKYISFVDKYEAKMIVGTIIGNEYIIPTLGVWDTFDEIDFELLPEQFVLKTTHDSGGVVIVNDRKKFNVAEAKKKIENSLKKNYYYAGREWPYKNVNPRIICEKYLQNVDETLNDYKVFVFNGKAEFIQVDYDRFVDHHRSFYDSDWNYVPFTTCYPTNEDHKIEKPSNLKKMIESAEKISKELDTPAFLRVDFFVIDDSIKFGEVTFYHGSGMEIFTPSVYDEKLGGMIEL